MTDTDAAADGVHSATHATHSASSSRSCVHHEPDEYVEWLGMDETRAQQHAAQHEQHHSEDDDHDDVDDDEEDDANNTSTHIANDVLI